MVNKALPHGHSAPTRLPAVSHAPLDLASEILGEEWRSKMVTMTQPLLDETIHLPTNTCRDDTNGAPNEAEIMVHLDELLHFVLDPALLRGHVVVHVLRRHVHLPKTAPAVPFSNF